MRELAYLFERTADNLVTGAGGERELLGVSLEDGVDAPVLDLEAEPPADPSTEFHPPISVDDTKRLHIFELPQQFLRGPSVVTAARQRLLAMPRCSHLERKRSTGEVWRAVPKVFIETDD